MDSESPCPCIAAHSQPCAQHQSPWDCPDVLVVYNPRLRAWGLPIRDGGTSMVTIEHCPWCGLRLPESPPSAWPDDD